MRVDRRWLWVGGILAAAGAALALGVPLATLLTLAAVPACPAAMYLGMCGMGMMGRMQGRTEAGGAASPDGRDSGTVAHRAAGGSGAGRAMAR